jgi:hypothetical protein
MTYDEMIAVIQAAKAGKVIERQDGAQCWVRFRGLDFNFANYKYRVKPEPKRCWVRFVDGWPMHVNSQEVEGYTEMVEVVR